MPRNDGNKFVKEEIKRLAKAEKNLEHAKSLLEEYSGSLTPEEVKKVKAKISRKAKTLEEKNRTFNGI